MNVYVDRLEPYGFRISGSDLIFDDLFDYSTKCWIIDPATASKTSTFTSSQVESNFGQTYTDGLSVTAASFTQAAWTAASWTGGTLETFVRKEMVDWAHRNLDQHLTYTLLLLYGSVSGTSYIVPIFYVGNSVDCNLNQTITDVFPTDSANQAISSAITEDNSLLVVSCLPTTSTASVKVCSISETDNIPVLTTIATITNPNTTTGDSFGGSLLGSTECSTKGLDITGFICDDGKRRIVIGSGGNDTGGTDRGQAYVYSSPPPFSTWTLEQTIQSSDIANGDRFGITCTIDGYGNWMAISSPYNDTGAADRGAIYIFSRSGTTWTEIQKVQYTANTKLGLRGLIISYDGTYLTASSTSDRGLWKGHTHVWKRTDSTWSSYANITNNGNFGMWCCADRYGNRFAKDGGGGVDVYVNNGSTFVLEQHLTPSVIYTYADNHPISMSPDGCFVECVGNKGNLIYQYSYFDIFYRKESVWYPHCKFSPININSYYITASESCITSKYFCTSGSSGTKSRVLLAKIGTWDNKL